MPLRSMLNPSGPPVLRALAAQILVFALLACLAWLPVPRPPLWVWPLLQGVLAAILARRWGLGAGWQAFQGVLPLALAWQLGHAVPVWIYPTALGGLLLIFGGGILSRVPLYNSNRAAWEALAKLLPAESGQAVADLGAGLGGPLRYLAARRPDLRFTGVEASPLVWLVARLRTRSVRSNCLVRFGSLWKLPLDGFQVVYAFLSPAPMAALWRKVLGEMLPGSLLISHTFRVPGIAPDRIVPLPGRRDACLLVYRIPERGDSQEGTVPAEEGGVETRPCS